MPEETGEKTQIITYTLPENYIPVAQELKRKKKKWYFWLTGN